MSYAPPEKVKSFKFHPRKVECPNVKPRATVRDAVEVYGSERAAVAAIERQLAAIGPDLEPSQRNAAENALLILSAVHTLTLRKDGDSDAEGDSAEVLAAALGTTPRYEKRVMGGTKTRLTLTPKQVRALNAQGFILKHE